MGTPDVKMQCLEILYRTARTSDQLFSVRGFPCVLLNQCFSNCRVAARYRALASIIPGPRLNKKKEFTGLQSHKG
jgi:hypothetical protein